MILVTNYNAIDSSLRFKRHMSVENCYFRLANLMILTWITDFTSGCEKWSSARPRSAKVTSSLQCELGALGWVQEELAFESVVNMIKVFY